MPQVRHSEVREVLHLHDPLAAIWADVALPIKSDSALKRLRLVCALWKQPARDRGIAAAMTVKGIYDFVIRVGGGRWAEIA